MIRLNDYSDAAKVDEETVQRWIVDMAIRLRNDPEASYYIMNSGDTMVVVIRYAPDWIGVYRTKIVEYGSFKSVDALASGTAQPGY